MENKIVDRLTKLQEHIDRYKQLYSQLKECIQPVKRQSLSIQLSNSKKRIDGLTNEVKAMINAPILEITYKIADIIYHARLANMNNSEAIFLLNVMAQSQGYNIEILEIKEISTFLCDGKL